MKESSEPVLQPRLCQAKYMTHQSGLFCRT